MLKRPGLDPRSTGKHLSIFAHPTREFALILPCSSVALAPTVIAFRNVAIHLQSHPSSVGL
ncbi:uncharacterized protein A1O5_04012 [Cladophialophora psammophila CBS 110553]|uniref:Uncharacterized protein n=1 Tax=Cladophialophora psammophila CBS 110553 TaxID=1182543 RepID=W9XRF8_9EURO|nr:uncharacterized protein A1O5_04012 [Cladophialophora psammophila CBS 110553]EXJ72864.1 hypothetical protein A1O5_04012 [Cladophialophora psammophila CBS 110553]